MKKNILLGCLLLLPALGFGEVVSSISYNPSRMGEYDYLKVADSATLRGGLSTPRMDIATSGTITVTTDTTSRIYDLLSVAGESGSSIDMPRTAFHGNTMNAYSGYESVSTSTPAGLLSKVNAMGGTQTYNQDSYIQTLNAVNILRQKAGTVKGNTLTVEGNNGSSVDLYGEESTNGFYLSGNDIPEPTGAHTNTGSTLNSCQLAWEKRKTSSKPTQEVWLLALKNCIPESPGGGSGDDDDDATKYKFRQVLSYLRVYNYCSDGTSWCACPNTLSVRSSDVPTAYLESCYSITGSSGQATEGAPCSQKGRYCFNPSECHLSGIVDVGVYAETPIFLCE